MSEFKGFIAKLSEKSGTGRNGPWTAYSGKVEQKDGTEYAQWFSFGFDKPSFKEGDYVKFEAAEENGRWKVQKGSVVVAKIPPARVQKERPAQSSGGGGFRRGGGGGNRYDGTGIQNRTNPEDAKRMTFSSARTAALELVGLLLAHDALPMSGAKTKAGQAQRYEEITAAVDKLSVKFHNDGISLRLLETVADTKIDTKADGALPDTEEANGNGTGKGQTATVRPEVDDEFEDSDEPADDSDPDFDE